jgi:hypothetical protein
MQHCLTDKTATFSIFIISYNDRLAGFGGNLGSDANSHKLG